MTCQDCEHGNHEIPGQSCDCPCHGHAPKALKRKDEYRPTQRSILELHQETGLSGLQIGKSLGINAKRCASMLYMAKEKMALRQLEEKEQRTTGKFLVPAKAKRPGRTQRSRRAPFGPR